MGTYRAIVRHVGYWRGEIHRWSTVYGFNGVPSPALDAAACDAVMNADSDMCFGPSPTDGGVFEVAIYDSASGGVPLVEKVYFDYTDPGSWTGYNGTAWTVTSAPVYPVREVALQVEWAAGLSSSGKPVKLRKWFHSVPDQGTPQAGPDVPTVDVTSLTVGATALQHCLGAYSLSMASVAGRLAGEATVLHNYGNHQMPRGRRRPPLVSASGRTRFPAGLLTVPGSDGSLDS